MLLYICISLCVKGQAGRDEEEKKQVLFSQK